MKKLLTILLVILSVLSLSFGLVACGEIEGDEEISHIHVYDKEVATETYLVSEATCTKKALYNYSCECGAKGTDTFEYGDFKHNYVKQVTDSTYLVSEATCTQKALYNYSCECGAKGTDTFEYGEFKHNYVNGVCDCNAVDESYVEEGLVFTLINNDTEYEVSDYTGSATRIAIPKIYNNKPVTSIGDYTFEDCTSLTSIEIPNSVTRIDYRAFEDCTSLTSIIIPNSVTSIGSSAFYWCDSLTSIIIPNSVTSIGSGAFEYCTSLTIYCEAKSQPSGWDSSWSPNSCPVVWDYLNNDVATNGYIYSVIDGIRYSLKDGVATVVEQPRNITTANIPSSVTYKGQSYSVTSIGFSAFSGCDSLTSIIIPNSVTSIGPYAFNYCRSLTSIIIPNSVTSINWYAFSWCDSLTSIIIPNSVTSMGGYAFRDCDSLTIYCEAKSQPSGWNSDWNYFGRPLVWDYLNNDVATNGYIYSVIDGIRYSLKDGVASVVEQPRNITTANIPSSVTYKGQSYSVTSIGYCAFYSCDSLTSVIFEENSQLTSIGYCAFSGCDSLTSIIIPNSVTSIGYDAFYYCDSLTIYCEATSKPSGWDSDWNYSNRPVYWYSETAPTTTGKYWHYVNGEITKW